MMMTADGPKVLEYNVRFETLAAGSMRHRDHRFEWTRAEFARWADRVGNAFGYALRIEPIGSPDGLDIGDDVDAALAAPPSAPPGACCCCWS